MSKPPFQPKAPVMEGCLQTNSKGERRCFQCGKYGTSCLTVQARVRQPLLEPAEPYTPRTATRWLGMNGLESIFWHSNLDGRAVQKLVDSGCNQTMVAARLMDAAKISSEGKVPIL